MKKINYILYCVCLLLFIFSIFSLIKVNNFENKAKKVELGVENGELSWRYVGESKWEKLYDLQLLKGKDGLDGKDGKDGLDGEDGKDGLDGKNGKNGLDGKDGKDGLDGKDGKDGLDGKDGKDGLDGKKIELKEENKILYFRYEGEEEWSELFNLKNEDNVLNITDGNNSNLSCLTDGKICSKGSTVSVRVNDEEVKDFYIVNDDGKYLTLILKGNLGTEKINTVSWYTANGGNSKEGPVSALVYLNQLTSGWTNIRPIENYSYNNYGSTNSGYKSLVIEDGVTTIYNNLGVGKTVENINLRARLLTYEEAKNSGCTTTASSCPKWLYEGLSDQSYSLTPFGYWLLSSSSSDKAYNIRNTGAISTNSTTDVTGRGIRPVIVINK